MDKDTEKPMVLVAEDSDDDAFFFKRTLLKSGIPCTLHFAVNGSEAVNFLKRTEAAGGELPDVLFLDLKMPLLNGFEVLEWILKQSFAPALRVVVLSGSDHQDDKARAARLGAVDYLVKPVKAEDLRRFIIPVEAAGACEPKMGAVA